MDILTNKALYENALYRNHNFVKNSLILTSRCKLYCSAYLGYLDCYHRQPNIPYTK